jgi:hypothetical protein
MEITDKTVDELAHLARLHFEGAEKEPYPFLGLHQLSQLFGLEGLVPFKRDLGDLEFLTFISCKIASSYISCHDLS